MHVKTDSRGTRFQRLITSPFRRFRRDQRGTIAIEFSIVALPFIALLFAIIETALVFFAGQVLETAAADSARLILTGQAQTAGFNQEAFRKAVCDRVTGLLDCAKGVYVDVRTFTSFSGISFAPPVDQDGKLINNFVYQPGAAEQIVVVRLFYEFPIYLQLWNPSLVNLAGNRRLLVATAAFRNEPFL